MSRFAFGLVSGPGGVPGNDAFTKILLHMDGANGGTTFTDSSVGGSAHSWSGVNASTSTSAFKFGPTSLLTSSGYVTTPDSADFTLGSSDWTVDFWVNRNGTSGICGLFGQTNSAGNTTATSLLGDFAGANQFEIQMYNGATRFAIATTTTFNDSNWRHIAAVRSGSGLYLFVNGNLEATGGISLALNDSANAWSVGRCGESASLGQFSGYIDEFRLSVGIARWTANFTPPTSQYI